MAKKKVDPESLFPTAWSDAAAAETVKQIDEEIIEELLSQPKEEYKVPEILLTAFLEPAPVKPFIATWDQIKNQLGSVSAMKSELTGVRITHGDAIAIFKTDAHRKLYEEWAAFKRQKG